MTTGNIICYPTEHICPILPPFKTKYEDYGKPRTDNVDTTYTQLIESITGEKFSDFCEIVATNTLSNSWRKETTEIWSDELKHNLSQYYCFIRPGDYCDVTDIKMVYEHEWYYNKIIEQFVAIDARPHFNAKNTTTFIDVLSNFFTVKYFWVDGDISMALDNTPLELLIEYDKVRCDYTNISIINKETGATKQTTHHSLYSLIIEINETLAKIGCGDKLLDASKIINYQFNSYVISQSKLNLFENFIEALNNLTAKAVNEQEAYEILQETDIKAILDIGFKDIEQYTSVMTLKHVILEDLKDCCAEFNAGLLRGSIIKSLRNRILVFEFINTTGQFFDNLNMLGFITPQSTLYKDCYSDMCVDYYKFIYTMGSLGLFFDVSNYASQSIEYGALASISESAAAFLRDAEYDDGEDEGYDDEFIDYEEH
ncbi:MAG: hypothetical protein ACRDD8_14115 [Bacteroidales bacterium]